MAEKKKIAEKEESKKTEVAVTAKKVPATRKPREKPAALAPAGTDKADVKVNVFVGILQKQPTDKSALARLPWPPHRKKLIIPIQPCKLKLIRKRLQMANFAKESCSITLYRVNLC